MDDELVQMHVVQMGISQLLVFEDKLEAEHFRRLMREKEGRVGPLFQPDGWEGRTGFFCYSRGLLATMLQENPHYHVRGSLGRSRAGQAKSES